MKSNKGITLVVLVIIVAVLIIITSVAISTGTSSLNSTQLKGFYTQLEIVQKRVDEIASNDEFYIDENGNKIQLTETGLGYGENGFNIEALTTIIAIEGGNSLDDYIQNFRYFTKGQVKTILGVNNIDYNLFINFEERIIIAEEGIKLKDKTYYMLQSATYFVKNYSKTESDVDFTVSAKDLTDGKYKIIIIPKNTGNSIIKYKEVSTKYWEKTNELEINVTGTLPKYFDIQYKDLSINKSITKSYGIYLDKNNNVQITLIKKVYTVQDLLDIQENAKISEEYTKTYILMNDISFTPSIEYPNLYLDDYNIYYWKPIGEITLENNAVFKGNNKEIHVNYTDSDNANYTVTYNKENNYSEPEYEFNITTWLVDEGTKEELADFTDIYNVIDESSPMKIEKTVKVKRGVQNAIKVQAIPSNKSFNPSIIKTIKVENPSKINTSVELEIKYRDVILTINVTPNKAEIEMKNTSGSIISSGTGTASVTVQEGAMVNWCASLENGYMKQSGTITVKENTTLNIELKELTELVSYIGYYADVDGNGTVDGIIYADLAVADSGRWGNGYGSYSYIKKEILNKYYISQDKYKYKNFKEKPVIAPIDKVEKNDRFYVMALEDFITEEYDAFYWYSNAYNKMDDYKETTSVDFGTGKQNTATMMNKVYGDGLKITDIWYNIGSKVNEGWFLPSRAEWGAFGDFAEKQGLTKSNLSHYGINSYYWTSSQSDKYSAWYANLLEHMEIGDYPVDYTDCVRLSTTF